MDVFLDFSLTNGEQQNELAISADEIKPNMPNPSPRALDDFGLVFAIDEEDKNWKKRETDGEDILSLYTTFGSVGADSRTRSVKERREIRRKAAAAAKVHEFGQEQGVSEGSRCKQRRVKNRASVEKCRKKQRERLEKLKEEETELTEENNIMDQLVANLLANERYRRVLKMLEWK